MIRTPPSGSIPNRPLVSAALPTGDSVLSMIKEASGDHAEHDAHGSAADSSIAHRLARLEALVDQSIGSSIAERLEAVQNKIIEEAVEREAQDKVLMAHMVSISRGASTQAAPSTGLNEDLTGHLEIITEQMEACRQLCEGKLTSLQRNVTDLKGRMDILEVRTEVFVEQGMDQAATAIAQRAAEASCANMKVLEELGRSDDVQLGETLLEMQEPSSQPDVQAAIAAALRTARAEWRAELALEDKSSGSDSVQELGRTLVQEFERSIVDIVEQAVNEARSEARKASRSVIASDQAGSLDSHDKRLTAIEDAVQSLGLAVDKVRYTPDDASQIGQDFEMEKDGLAHLQEMSDTVVRIGRLSENTQQTHAALQADIVALRSEMRRLVSVDLHAMLNNLQRLQMQSESVRVQVMEMLEQNKSALHTEIQARLKEDQRIEDTCQTKFKELVDTCQHKFKDLAEMMGGEQNGEVRKKVDQLFVKELSPVQGQRSIVSSESEPLNREGDAGSSAQQKNSIDSTVSSAGLSVSSEGSRLAQAKLGRAGESSQVVDDLRNTILTYFRSEFQDHVSQTLQKLQPQTSVLDQSYPEPQAVDSIKAPPFSPSAPLLRERPTGSIPQTHSSATAGNAGSAPQTVNMPQSGSPALTPRPMSPATGGSLLVPVSSAASKAVKSSSVGGSVQLSLAPEGVTSMKRSSLSPLRSTSGSSTMPASMSSTMPSQIHSVAPAVASPRLSPQPSLTPAAVPAVPVKGLAGSASPPTVHLKGFAGLASPRGVVRQISQSTPRSSFGGNLPPGFSQIPVPKAYPSLPSPRV